MMERFFQKITRSLVENENISKEYEAVYQYALQSVLILGFNIFLSILIGIFLNRLGCCLLFLGAMFLLRSDAGGYHASSLAACYLLSFSALISTLFLVDILNTYGAIVLVMAAGVSAVLIFKFAPLDTKKRPLTINERKCIGKRARRTVCLEFLAGFLFLMLDHCAAYTVWSAILWCGIGYAAWFVEKKVKSGSRYKRNKK